MPMYKVITLAHGSGGTATSELIDNIFAKEFSNEILNDMEDAAVIPVNGKIAVTTDSFVVTPIEFNGGDIGRLSICGTVNDMLMRGANPSYITCGFILEEGLPFKVLKNIVHSMAETAREAGTKIIAGDTKVIEGKGGIYINTTGVGIIPDGVNISAKNARPGDKIIVSGAMGDHHAAILSKRMNLDSDIETDAAPLVEMVMKLRELKVHSLRDITRGDLATVLNELANTSNTTFHIDEKAITVHESVRNFAGLLGLEPLYMGNEGKLVCIVDDSDADKALNAIQSSKYGSEAAIIGKVTGRENNNVLLKTEFGAERIILPLEGEGLPRIC